MVPQWPSSRGLMCSRRQRLAQQRIVEQIDLPDREVVRGAPIGVDRGEFGLCQRSGGGISRLGECVQWLISPGPGRGAAGIVSPLNDHAAPGSGFDRNHPTFVRSRRFCGQYRAPHRLRQRQIAVAAGKRRLYRPRFLGHRIEAYAA